MERVVGRWRWRTVRFREESVRVRGGGGREGDWVGMLLAGALEEVWWVGGLALLF